MENQKFKIHYQHYLFELNFKTQNCLSITVTDMHEGRKFQNNNIEFSKIQKKSILTALRDENTKEIKCTISQESKLKNEQEKLIKEKYQKEKCLKISFTVSLEYILPFSQHAILYEIESLDRAQNLIPKKLTKQTVRQIKKQIDEIEEATMVAEPQQEQQSFKVYEVGNMSFVKSKTQDDKVAALLVGFNVFVIILWIAYLSFLQSLGLTLVSLGLYYLYWCTSKHTIKEVELKKGVYKIQVSGAFSTTNYNTIGADSFILHAEFNQWSSKKLKINIQGNYSYAYPFTGTFLISSKKQQTLLIKIQKNINFCTSTIQNGIITVERLPPFIKIN